MTRKVVVYDANVLYPAPLRDTLMRLALIGLFQARWTDAIHDEWIRNLHKKRPELSLQKLHRVRQLMDKFVPDALVTGYEALIPSIVLPDPDDRHVVAAALHGKADAIITLNVKDFPASELGKYGIEVIRPDKFVLMQLKAAPMSVVGGSTHSTNGDVKSHPDSRRFPVDVGTESFAPKRHGTSEFRAPLVSIVTVTLFRMS